MDALPDGADPPDEDRDERMVRALRGLLDKETPVPLGLRSRLEAEVVAAHAKSRRPGWIAPLVLAAVVFSVVATAAPAQTSGEVLGSLALGALVYAVSFRLLAGRRHG